MSIEEFGYEDQLHRALTTKDLVIYGLIFMVPIAPYSVFGFVYNDAKGMVPLAYLVGLVGMFFTALSYAAMSRAFPLAGSVYTYAQRGLHEIAGFFSGWLILLDYILVPSLLYLFSAVALRPIFPTVPAWVWLVAIHLLQCRRELRRHPIHGTREPLHADHGTGGARAVRGLGAWSRCTAAAAPAD